MQNYYEVLRLPQGASQSEIKRAYFKLVREYSPEKHPEKFKEIREAYEFLKNAEEIGPSFPAMEDPLAVRFLKLILEYEKKYDFVMFRDACEEALRLFPDEIQFQYLLAVAQRKNGNTGKAIKTGEELVKKAPENKWFWRELALAYIERGFTKKAFPYILKAFEMGCVDNDFLYVASIACDEINHSEESIKLLLALVKKEKRWKREEMPELLEAYFALCVLGVRKEAELKEILQLLVEFLQQYAMYLAENTTLLLEILTTLMLCSHEKEESEKIVQVIKENCHIDEIDELIEVMQEERMFDRLYSDERIGVTIKRGIQPYFDREINYDMQTYGILDVKLCLLKERDEVLPQLEILEKEYPAYYEKISDFAEKLKSDKNLDYLKDTLQRQYVSLAQYVDGGQYFELYPEEKIKSFGRVIYENDETTPYVRSEKKIGRNDPCPCGSGKKYKQCCMKK